MTFLNLCDFAQESKQRGRVLVLTGIENDPDEAMSNCLARELKYLN